MRIAIVLLLAGLLITAGTARAQVITGRVLEEGTRAPVNQSEIVLIDASGTSRGRALSDSAGRFRLPVSAQGQYTLRVRHIAYAEYQSKSIDVGRTETVEVEIRLGRTVIPLEPLVVTARLRDSGRMAGFNERRHSSSFGRFLTRADIERRAAGRTSDMLRSIPGVTVTPVRLRGRSGPERSLIAMRSGAGICEPAFFIDGVRVRQSAESSMDDILTPDMLEGVEIYTVSAGAPPQYSEQGTCGVVLFWTRQGEGGEKWSWKRLLIGASGVALLILLLK